MKTPRKPAPAIQLPLLLETSKPKRMPPAFASDPRYLERRAMEAQRVKRCTACNLVKPYSEFHPSYRKGATTVGGVMNHCKDCALTKQRKAHMQRAYGITLEKYDAIYEAQDGKCAICGTPGKSRSTDKTDHTRAGSRSGVLVVDHDHETLEVRGLLCFGCNAGLGRFLDNTDLLRKALAYLESYRDSSLYFTK